MGIVLGDHGIYLFSGESQHGHAECQPTDCPTLGCRTPAYTDCPGKFKYNIHVYCPGSQHLKLIMKLTHYFGVKYRQNLCHAKSCSLFCQLVLIPILILHDWFFFYLVLIAINWHIYSVKQICGLTF